MRTLNKTQIKNWKIENLKVWSKNEEFEISKMKILKNHNTSGHLRRFCSETPIFSKIRLKKWKMKVVRNGQRKSRTSPGCPYKTSERTLEHKLGDIWLSSALPVAAKLGYSAVFSLKSQEMLKMIKNAFEKWNIKVVRNGHRKLRTSPECPYGRPAKLLDTNWVIKENVM